MSEPRVYEPVFDSQLIHSRVLDSPWKRLWACWKVLTGQAGIIIIGKSDE